VELTEVLLEANQRAHIFIVFR